MNIHKIWSNDGKPMHGVVHATVGVGMYIDTLCPTHVGDLHYWRSTFAPVTCKVCLHHLAKGAATEPRVSWEQIQSGNFEGPQP